MSTKLSIYLEKELVMSNILDPSKSYLIGRAENCDIILPPHKGISRQHILLSYQNDVWKLEVLSRFGELFQDNVKVDHVDLTKNIEFMVPPFRFRIEVSEEQNSAGTFTEKSRIPTVNTKISNSATAHALNFHNENPEHAGGTIVGHLPVVANLKLLDDNGEAKKIYRLEGDAWVAGRDSSCAVFIDSKKFSRKHFEIHKQGTQFYVRDLNSVNGTLLNAQQVPADSWTRLNSGDIIQVLNKHFIFELEDTHFADRLSEAHQLISTEPTLEEDHNLPQMDYIEQPQEQPDKKAQLLRIILISVILIAGAGVFLLDGQGKKDSSPIKKKAASKQEEAWGKLTKLKQDEIKDAYELAVSLFRQGKYEMARQKAFMVNQILPLGYQDSLDIEKMAQQGIDDIAAKTKLEAEEKERADREDKIIKQVAICKKLLNTNIEVRVIDDCLAPVIEFDPSHGAIIDLKMQVDKIIADRNIRNSQKAEYNDKVSQRTKLFNKAVELHKKEQFLLALAAYNANIESKLPDPNETRSRSRAEISRIEKELEVRQAKYENEADTSYKKGDLKNTILSLRKAVSINPENEVTKGRLSVVDFELKKQMQGLFQEGILEESLGELETAKTKWKKIIDLSLPDEEYYKRATLKLKKYGSL